MASHKALFGVLALALLFVLVIVHVTVIDGLASDDDKKKEPTSSEEMSAAVRAAQLDGPCDDGVHNFVVVESRKRAKTPARISNFSGVIYDYDRQPACFSARPSVSLPGWLKLTGGKLVVDRDYDIVGTSFIHLTIYSKSLDDYLCLNGTSSIAIIPDKYCKLDLCEFIGADICQVIEKQGVHTLEELEEKIQFNRTLELPEAPSILGISLLDLFSGEFSFVFTIKKEEEILIIIDIPTNEKYLQIGVA